MMVSLVCGVIVMGSGGGPGPGFMLGGFLKAESESMRCHRTSTYVLRIERSAAFYNVMFLAMCHTMIGDMFVLAPAATLYFLLYTLLCAMCASSGI